ILIYEKPHYYPGLLNGNAGIIQFLLNYYLYVKHDKATLNKINELFQKLIYQINTLPIESSLGNGYAGIYWLMQNLIRANILSPDSNHDVNKLLQIVASSIDGDIENNNFDYHYGFMGKYLLLQNADIECYREKLRKWLAIHTKNRDHILDFIKTKKNEINIGLAHGLPSLLLFLHNQKLLLKQNLEYFSKLLY